MAIGKTLQQRIEARKRERKKEDDQLIEDIVLCQIIPGWIPQGDIDPTGKRPKPGASEGSSYSDAKPAYGQNDAVARSNAERREANTILEREIENRLLSNIRG